MFSLPMERVAPLSSSIGIKNWSVPAELAALRHGGLGIERSLHLVHGRDFIWFRGEREIVFEVGVDAGLWPIDEVHVPDVGRAIEFGDR